MPRKYELWLDESGQFVDDQAKKESENPSLIGGILIDADVAQEIDLSKLIPPERRHATEMTKEEKRKYLIPTLKSVKKDYHARLFYIENPKYEYEKNNRQLYLRMMAEGLLQLMQALNAQAESVELDVIIAQRQDWQQHSANRRINEPDYIAKLQECIKIKKKQKRIWFHEDSRLNFRIGSAFQDPKLEVADYACYTRFRRKSGIFQNQREELKELFADSYLFEVSEISSTTYINCLLSNNQVADALIEIFTTVDHIKIEQEIEKICERLKVTSYRLIKSQMKQFTADIISYAANEDDYEMGERLLKKIDEYLFPMLEKNGFPYLYCQFHILLQLTDMLLREGAIIEARNSLEKCRTAQYGLGNSLEDVFTYYQLVEKEAILLIDEFRYREAYDLLSGVCDVFHAVMDCIVKEPSMKNRFPQMKSEYLGDALCMKIYAGMFLQRQNPDLYVRLCSDSDLALLQYPDSEGELERHRQYRSHIELEAGNYKSALEWLMMAKIYQITSTDLLDIRDFLSKLESTEYVISCQYYLMYYLLIMVEAKNAGNELASVMFQALNEQDAFLAKTGMVKSGKQNQMFNRVDIGLAAPRTTGISYHPQEINQWKYGSYLYKSHEYQEALRYFSEAVRLCYRYSNYGTMRITGIGVMAEMICCYCDAGMEKEAKKQYKNMISAIELLMTEDYPKETTEFIRELMNRAQRSMTGDILQKEALYELSRMITY